VALLRGRFGFESRTDCVKKSGAVIIQAQVIGNRPPISGGRLPAVYRLHALVVGRSPPVVNRPTAIVGRSPPVINDSVRIVK
jgi:hypothetical protein